MAPIPPTPPPDGAPQPAPAAAAERAAQQAAAVALATGDDKLRITLNATGDAIFAADAEADDQPLLFVNDHVLEMFQVPPALVPALTPARVMAQAGRYFVDPAAEAERVRTIIAGDTLVEDRLELNDGRTLLRRFEPTWAAGRRVRVWTFRDISAQVQAQRGRAAAESQQRALMEAFPGYIACVDADLRYTFINPALCDLVGQVPAALIGRGVRDFAPPDQADLAAARVARALGGETLSFERSYPAVDGGEPRHVMYTLAPGTEPGSGRPLCMVFGTDITSLKLSEAALIRARDEAEAANRAKSTFLSSMSHELRTPLNAVLGFAQLLAADPALGVSQRDKVQHILQGGNHLLALINDILDLARIESGRVEFRLEPIALPELAAECLSLVAADAAKRGIALLPPPALAAAPLSVLADRRRLQQVLLNLLGNAIKYNRPGGWVRLEWSTMDTRVRCVVRDNGPGIDAAKQPRLFQAFDRLDAEHGSVEGTGIGLALCRRLLRLMRGEIGVDSRPGEGSSFWFTLAPADVPVPLPPEQTSGTPPDERHPRAASAGARRARRVLCIEDNPVNLLLIQAMVESLPDTVAQGIAEPLAGLAAALADPPDLVLLDIRMPVMDGFEVLRRLRAAAATRSVPVIAVSANAMPQDVARGLAAGFDAYLAKPVALPVLAKAIADTIGPAADRR